MDYGIVVLAAMLGAVVVWLLQRSRAERLFLLQQQLTDNDAQLQQLRQELSQAQQDKVSALTRLEEALKHHSEQKQVLERAEERLTTAFQALSGESLKSNNQAFLALAKETLETVVSRMRGEFGEKETAIKNVVNGLDSALQRYQEQVRQFEQQRAGDYGSLQTQIASLLSANQQLQRETGNLVSALRRPEVRGRWGEVTLRRVVELAGMSEHCDFTEQVSRDGESGRIRPDLIVQLPAQRQIVVDSKISLDAYLDATAADEESIRQQQMQRHARQLRVHMKALSAKSYWSQFSQAPEFVVMFIPGESFLSAALAIDHTLIEDGMQEGVIIATPTTLIALLRAVAFGWRQELIARHAQEIASLGKEVYERFAPFLDHLNRTGGFLGQATDSYNKMVSSLERRVMVSVRKFRDLGAVGGSELPELKSVDRTPVRARPEIESGVEPAA